ncbi:MAG: MalT-like region, partial [Bacteroidota bacterium]
MRAITLSVVFYFLSIFAVVATPIDSLKNLLKSAQRPAEKIELQLNLSNELMKQDLNLALDYAQQALFLAKKEGDAKLQINASKQIGTIFYYSGIIDKAIEWIIASRDLAVKFDDKAGVLNANINLGTMHIGLGDHKKAREAFLKGDSLIFSTYESLGKPVPFDDLVKL